MAIYWSYAGTAAQTLYMTVQRTDTVQFLNPGNGQWLAQGSGTFDTFKIAMTEGTGFNAGSYTAVVANTPAEKVPVNIRVHNSGGTLVLQVSTVWINGGEVVRPDGPTVSASGVREQVLDVLTNEQLAELVSVPAGSATVAEMIQLLYMALRNSSVSTNAAYTIKRANGTAFGVASLEETPTSLTRGDLRDAV